MKMFGFFILVVFATNILINACKIPESKISFVDRARQKNRFQFKQGLLLKIDSLIQNGESHSIDDDGWSSLTWAVNFSDYKSENLENLLSESVKNLSAFPGRTQQTILEMIYSQYPHQFGKSVGVFINEVKEVKPFVTAIHCILRTAAASDTEYYRQLIREKFDDWQQNAHLVMLDFYLSPDKTSRPPFTDLLAHPFENKCTVIFSFQRDNRDYPGMTVIRNTDGFFARDEYGRIFGIPHLARSNSNLPGYITNGNSPQGVFSIQGTAFSDNVFIGPSETLQLVLPWEVSMDRYCHRENDTQHGWNIDEYIHLLPESWRNYIPMREAYYAGQAGRSEIIAHGTTIDPAWYAGQPFYPMTPSLGCLTATELWSSLNGSCLVSDQQALIDLYKKSGSKDGYFIVVNVDDHNAPVTLNELLPDLYMAEEKIKP